MPGLWIDVENSSGVKYGSGPITTATGWNTTESLDAMGSFSFAMPAADPQAALLASKRYVRAWLAPDEPTAWPGQMLELGWGIIDRIEIKPSANGPTMIEVRGTDLLAELVNTTVGDLALYLDETRSPDEVYHETGSQITWEPGDSIDLDNDPLTYIYVRDAEQFMAISVTLGASKNTTAAVLKAQYYNEAATEPDWQNLNITDGTNSGGKTFGKNGTISFDPPSGWGLEPGALYTIRLYCDDADLTTVTFNTITITVRQPTETALHDIMDQAPDGWSLDTAGGATATETSVYYKMTWQSVLSALIWLAEQTGEHFIKAPTGRRVRWLGTAQDDSGLHVVAGDPGATPSEFALYLLELQIIRDATPLFTRIYPRGTGNGDEQITLADATDSAPTGYTLNAGSGYVERNAAVTEFGRIDLATDYPDIAALDGSDDARAYAGNMLLQRAVEDLKRGSYEQVAYACRVVPSIYRVLPGQMIHLIYHEWYADYHAVNVDDDLWVLDVESTITPSGDAYTVGLTLAVVDRRPETDDDRHAREITRAFNSRMQPLPLKGIISEADGIPYYIGVSHGMVTAIKRKTPVADGTYDVATLTVEDGVIVEITQP